ncbi:hypothetical protein SCB49_11819 [unidentified eubacterium SCB49]|nr:hypothetical protein SCB49_11819 [unidentified eubacterium SCB49]
MTDRIKLLWDFKGPNAQKTAEHHVIHLDEFIVSEKINDSFTQVQTINPNHTVAEMIVPNQYMKDLKVRLKPTRGQLYNE